MNTRSHLVILFNSLSFVPPTHMQHVFPSQAAGSIGYTFSDPTNPCCLQNPGFVEIGDEKTVVVREGPQKKANKQTNTQKTEEFCPPPPEKKIATIFVTINLSFFFANLGSILIVSKDLSQSSKSNPSIWFGKCRRGIVAERDSP